MSLRKVKQPTIYSSVHKDPKTGEPLPIKLTNAEQYHANYLQKQVNEKFYNALGFEVSITTLTQISKKVAEQKLYTIPFADYVPVKVGEGSFMSNLETFRTFDIVDEFESGIINTGTTARQSVAEAGVDALNIKINNWAKNCGWSIFDLEMAAKSGNWDIVAAKEKTRKRNWDLGLQRVAFVGARGQNSTTGSCQGVLNLNTGQFDTTLITAALNGLTYSNIAIFVQNAIQKYRANCNYTAYPTHFIIPESDYNGLAVQTSPQFPIKTMLALLQEAFALITMNPKFKILPCVYAMTANAGASGTLPSGAATGIYTLLNHDEDSLVMNIPLDYTNTVGNSVEGFNFFTCGYGQFTGVLAIRPLEVYYAGY